MSSRQLRKLQQQKELEKLQAEGPDTKTNDSDDSEDEVPIRKPAKPSVFAGFAALGDQDNEDDDDDDDAEPTEPTSGPAQAEARTGTLSNSSKKNKKKKKKAKKTASSLGPSAADTPAQTPSGADDIDRALQELNLTRTRQSAGAGTEADDARAKAYERICELLQINTHQLRVINEMRSLFGREAIAAAQHEENEEHARTRTRHTADNQDIDAFFRGPPAPPGHSLPEVTLRRNPFVQGDKSWPRASTEGLAMRQIKEDQAEMGKKHGRGTVEFAFTHDLTYNKLEREYFQQVQMHDSNRLVFYLHRHPYHISSLLQVSKIAAQSASKGLSTELCERALFTFGRVSLSSFKQKMEEGKARLDFRRPENRQFWLAGYHYIQALIQKGTYRTALEWAKLLYSMDLSDPYGMIHFIHDLAIRAHESKWFIDFCDSEVLDKFDTMQDYVRQTLVLARLQQEDTAGAKALLLEGMEKLPWLYSHLYKELNLDVPKAIWGLQAREMDEQLFVELYVHQTKSLWNNSQAIGLLKEAAGVAKKADTQMFGAPPVAGLNVARFIHVGNITSLVGYVIKDIMREPNWAFDPIPPPEEENIFSHDSQKMPWRPPPEISPLFGDFQTPYEVDLQRRMRTLELTPVDGIYLRQLLTHAQESNQPAEVLRLLQNALDTVPDGDMGENDEMAEEGEDADSGRNGITPGILQTLWDVFSRAGAPNPETVDYSSDEFASENRMPGTWESDSASDVEGRYWD
ncbi:hypothetical protein GGS20DRAFT_564981 [Poronia punctata]|nr:hypothetical protein GGS20DRAFT_564981 [Poronia punctata]